MTTNWLLFWLIVFSAITLMSVTASIASIFRKSNDTEDES